MKGIKTLKIYRKYRTRRWGFSTVPEIRLEGKWLKKLGFEEGNQVQVKQEQNKLTITLCKKESSK